MDAKPQKLVKIRMIVEYETEVPLDWDDYRVEFFYNESSHCRSNQIQDLEDLDKKYGCICNFTRIEYIGEVGDGQVVTSDNGEPVYATESRPVSAPTDEKDRGWRAPDNYGLDD